MFIWILSTTLHEIFCKIILNFQVIVKSVKNPDDILWVNNLFAGWERTISGSACRLCCPAHNSSKVETLFLGPNYQNKLFTLKWKPFRLMRRNWSGMCLWSGMIIPAGHAACGRAWYVLPDSTSASELCPGEKNKIKTLQLRWIHTKFLFLEMDIWYCNFIKNF